MPMKHKKVSGKAASSDPTKIDGPAWDDGHVNPVTAVTPSAGVATFDCSLGDYFTLAPTANVTGLAFSNLPESPNGASLLIRITQDSTARTIAWPSSFKWAGGVPPAVSTAAGAVDMLAITTFDQGTTWLATLAKAFG